MLRLQGRETNLCSNADEPEPDTSPADCVTGCVDEMVLEDKRRAAGDLPDSRAIAAATMRDREVVASGRLVAQNSC